MHETSRMGVPTQNQTFRHDCEPVPTLMPENIMFATTTNMLRN